MNNFYIFDRADNDFSCLFKITCTHSFVIGAKSNLESKRMYSAKADKSKRVIVDQTDYKDVNEINAKHVKNQLVLTEH